MARRGRRADPRRRRPRRCAAGRAARPPRPRGRPGDAVALARVARVARRSAREVGRTLLDLAVATRADRLRIGRDLLARAAELLRRCRPARRRRPAHASAAAARRPRGAPRRRDGRPRGRRGDADAARPGRAPAAGRARPGRRAPRGRADARRDLARRRARPRARRARRGRRASASSTCSTTSRPPPARLPAGVRRRAAPPARRRRASGSRATSARSSSSTRSPSAGRRDRTTPTRLEARRPRPRPRRRLPRLRRSGRARGSGCAGWVANEPGGRVRCVAEGPRAALERCSRRSGRARRAPRRARRRDAGRPPTGEFAGFEVRSGWHCGRLTDAAYTRVTERAGTGGTSGRCQRAGAAHPSVPWSSSPSPRSCPGCTAPCSTPSPTSRRAAAAREAADDPRRGDARLLARLDTRRGAPPAQPPRPRRPDRRRPRTASGTTAVVVETARADARRPGAHAPPERRARARLPAWTPRRRPHLDPGLTGQDARPVPGVDNGYLAGYRVRFDEAGPDGRLRTSDPPPLRAGRRLAPLRAPRLRPRLVPGARRSAGSCAASSSSSTRRSRWATRCGSSTAVVGHRRIWARRLGECRLADGRLAARVTTDWVLLDGATGSSASRPTSASRSRTPRSTSEILRVPPPDGRAGAHARRSRVRPQRPRPARPREQRRLRRLAGRGARGRRLGRPTAPAGRAEHAPPRVPRLRRARRRGRRSTCTATAGAGAPGSGEPDGPELVRACGADRDARRA